MLTNDQPLISIDSPATVDGHYDCFVNGEHQPNIMYRYLMLVFTLIIHYLRRADCLAKLVTGTSTGVLVDSDGAASPSASALGDEGEIQIKRL